ncbi:MAG TPA: LLM class flavin-dependent oxidoreductase [Stellaceae bacterium]|nr:LLM class flavin-dependent oxidoreductase [Stellaceae bacterium]
MTGTGNQRQMHLAAFLFNTGNHIASWRYPPTKTSEFLTFPFYRKLAETAERGKFDLVFHSDGVGINDRYDDIVRRTVTIRPEPISLLSALAAVTDRVGLAATISTTYNEPFHVARKFATLDFLSGGRAAMNVVTSSTTLEANNFGKAEHLEHATRYRRAQEFVEVAKALWDSWEDEALVFDREEGSFADPAKVHRLDHKGEFFTVRGPLNVPRPPQGHPVIIQAGVSPTGQNLAARIADIVFVVNPSLADAKLRYRTLKELVGTAGRSPSDVKILSGIMPIIGATTQEARDKARQLDDLIHPTIAVAYLSDLLDFDLSAYPIDGPLPDLPETNGEQGRSRMIIDRAKRENLSIREASAGLVAARGHASFVGTPVQIADEMEKWFTEAACDGFNVMPAYHPGGLEEFVDLVVPELQRRGLFRREYTGRTLRDHLGLGRPANGFDRAAAGR